MTPTPGTPFSAKQSGPEPEPQLFAIQGPHCSGADSFSHPPGKTRKVMIMLKALALNCTLKPDPMQASSTDAMIAVLADAFGDAGVTVAETVRVASLDIRPGVTSDEGDGDAWPGLRDKILAHDILIFGSPIWMGQISSVAKRVLERMDAFLDETDGSCPWRGVAEV
jgi:hypothetical protein